MELTVLWSHGEKCTCSCENTIGSATFVVAHQRAGVSTVIQLLGGFGVATADVDQAPEDAEVMDRGLFARPCLIGHTAVEWGIERQVANVVGREDCFPPELGGEP